MAYLQKSKRKGTNKHLGDAPGGKGGGYLQNGGTAGSPRVSHGKASEKRLANELGMRETFASGALVIDKGDATFSANINGEVFRGRLECKSTVNASLSVKKEWLDKIQSESIARGEVPLFSMSFVDEAGQPLDANSDWFAMPKWLLAKLLGVDHG